MTIPMVKAANFGHKSFRTALYFDIVYYEF